MMLMVPPPSLRRKDLRRERDRQRGRLGRGRFDALVTRVVKTTRQALEAGSIAQPFAFEGAFRHALRGMLCLEGWKWTDADTMAREILAEAFKVLRANRPSWNEGQREWTVEAGTLIERERCARRGCGKPLPEGHYKFCSFECARYQSAETHYRRNVTEEKASWLATRWL